MTLRVTIDIFSGRPNPVLELKGKEAKEALAMLQPGRPLEKDEPGLVPEPVLGYRGMMVEQVDTRSRKLPKSFRFLNGDLLGPKLNNKAQDEGFEDFVLASRALRELDLGRGFPPMLKKEIVRLARIRAGWFPRPIPWPPKPVCKCAPLYEPNWWNDGGQIQLHNNCYAYGSNYRTDTFRVIIPGGCQPGAAAGAMYKAITGPAVRAAAIADGAIDCPNANNKCPSEGHLVALVIWPGVDFHWYRKGRNGKWSHKPGSTRVTNVDNAGAYISDPRTAARGPYTQFVTFMQIMHGHIKIK